MQAGLGTLCITEKKRKKKEKNFHTEVEQKGKKERSLICLQFLGFHGSTNYNPHKQWCCLNVLKTTTTSFSFLFLSISHSSLSLSLGYLSKVMLINCSYNS